MQKSKLSKHINNAFSRWKSEFSKIYSSLPLNREVNWGRDFQGEIHSQDQIYAGFLVVLSLIPAAIIAQISAVPQLQAMAQFFATPVQTVITGFLMSSLLFLGSHLNKKPQPYSVAFKLTLRIMTVHPILTLLTLIPGGALFVLLAYGYLVSRAASITYQIPIRNALLFFGTVYIVFTLLQLQAIMRVG